MSCWRCGNSLFWSNTVFLLATMLISFALLTLPHISTSQPQSSEPKYQQVNMSCLVLNHPHRWGSAAVTDDTSQYQSDLHLQQQLTSFRSVRVKTIHVMDGRPLCLVLGTCFITIAIIFCNYWFRVFLLFSLSLLFFCALCSLDL